MATDHTKQHYYMAKPVGGGFKAYIFHYDTTGNRHVPVWTSDQTYDTSNEAEDAAILYIEETNMEASVGEITQGS